MFLNSSHDVSWATIDATWYRQAYPIVSKSIEEFSTDFIKNFYLNKGQMLGHSPNPFFDEEWYLLLNPDATAGVRLGRFTSGFDHYCQIGHVDRSPHWLFDISLYHQQHKDLTLENLQANGCYNSYDHYLKSGHREGRIAHLLFQPAYYRGQVEHPDLIEAEIAGLFGHFLRRLVPGIIEPVVSVYFDPVWYHSSYSTVINEPIRDDWRCGLRHYLTNSAPINFNPRSEFSEAYYLDRYRDIKSAVELGLFRTGYEHFITQGAGELRSPSLEIDLKWYYDTYETVRLAIKGGQVTDAFIHWITIGHENGLCAAPRLNKAPKKSQTNALFRLTTLNLLPNLARQKIDFTLNCPPDLSIILVIHNNLASTMRTLSSIRENYRGAIELILIGCCTNDGTRSIRHFVHGAKILLFGTDIGQWRSFNAGLNVVTAPITLFIQNDTVLLPNAIAVAMRRLASDSLIGAVGGKIIGTDECLQEAGGIVWPDGTIERYFQNASPLAPEANFTRDVDFCSSVFFLTRTSILVKLNGFDCDSVSEHYIEADLSLRMHQIGYSVIYDPAVVVRHLEDVQSFSNSATESQKTNQRQNFMNKNSDWIKCQSAWRSRSPLDSRFSKKSGQRILFIEDTIPLRMMGSGYPRSNDLIRAMIQLGSDVTVFPIMKCVANVAHIYYDFPDTVEIMHDRTIEDLLEFIQDRKHYYNFIWVARTHNLDKISHILDSIKYNFEDRPVLILDTEAIASVRLMESLKFNNDNVVFSLKETLDKEMFNVKKCDWVLTVNEKEAQFLRDLGLQRVSVVGHVREVIDSPATWAERKGILFLGAIHAMDSPNYDSLCWFVDKVLPLIVEQLDQDVYFTIAGYLSPDTNLTRFEGHSNITIVGSVLDLELLFNKHRVFVAPTRFAAGIPYKIHTAASYGLPVVATCILNEQIEWQDGQDLLCADASNPILFAKHVADLLQFESLWTSIQKNALNRIQTENSLTGYLEILQKVFSTAAKPVLFVVFLFESFVS